MRCLLSFGVLLLAVVAVLATTTPAFAQDPEQRLEILERHLMGAERKLEAAHDRGNERGVIEAQVLVDALRLAMDVERNLLHRKHRDRLDRPRPDRPDRPHRLPATAELMEHMLELDREIREAMENGSEDAERAMREKFSHLGKEVEAIFEAWLERTRNEDMRVKARGVMARMREAWVDGRREEALDHARHFDDMMRKAAEMGEREHPERERGASLPGMIERLLHLAAEATEADDAGNDDLVEKLRDEFRRVGEMAEERIKNGMQQLARQADDAHPRAEELLNKLGTAVERGSDDAIKLAERLEKLFGGGGDGPREMDPEDRERERMHEMERAQHANRLENELRQLEAESMELRARIEQLTAAGDTERVVDMVAEHNELRTRMEELRAMLEKLRRRR